MTKQKIEKELRSKTQNNNNLSSINRKKKILCDMKEK